MLSVEEARERILSYFAVLTAEERPLGECLGLVLAEDLIAPFDVPPLPNSAMDGYAVRASEVMAASESRPVVIPVDGMVAAGALPHGPLKRGTAMRIMTGAPVPEGADAVVPFEDTDELERRAEGKALDSIGIRVPPRRGASIRLAGEDIVKGSTVLTAGTVLRPGGIGVAASIGRKAVRVVRRPVVAIISTGNELLEPGQPFEAGKIYNSNAFTVAAAVEDAGGVPRVIGIARDSVESLSAALDDALSPAASNRRSGRDAAPADMVVTSAGVSKGDYDVVKDVLAQRGTVALWSVRMRPAKPLAFGTLEAGGGRKVPHLGLPGNPVSAMVAFEQFGRPAIHLMLGRKTSPRPTVQAVLDDPIANHDGRRVYARVVVYRGASGEYRARSTGTQSSGVLTSMASANGLAVCPEDVAEIAAGAVASVQMLDWPEEVF